jgi:hypothetical protein
MALRNNMVGQIHIQRELWKAFEKHVTIQSEKHYYPYQSIPHYEQREGGSTNNANPRIPRSYYLQMAEEAELMSGIH